MMLVKAWAFSAGLILAAGCASKAPPEPAPSPVAHQDPAPAPPVAKEESKVKLPPGAAKLPAPFEGTGWESLFDGHSLAGWQETPFAGRGEVNCQDGLILLDMGSPFTGIKWTNEFPQMNYEVAFDAMRLMGSDFFCALTVPFGTNCCSLVAGGWGGSLVGISSLDGLDASENETTKFVNFESGRWYRIRLRVTEKRIEGWIDKDKLVDVQTPDRRISVRPGDIELSQPFGLSAWQTAAAYREIKFRQVTGPAGKGD